MTPKVWQSLELAFTLFVQSFKQIAKTASSFIVCDIVHCKICYKLSLRSEVDLRLQL